MQNYHHYYFIGVGGIGMSALAAFALAQRKQVSGSDLHDSALIQDLKRQGASIFLSHEADHVVPSVDVVIYSEAIDPGLNPELLQAQELGIPCMTYFEALGEISKTLKTIAVAGTHGKSTTTALLGRALVEDGIDPLVIVGTKVPDFKNRNIYIGIGEYFVVEACEYRRSFLHLRPYGLVLLNCELDHPDYYADEADYVSAFRQLVEQVPADGFIVANVDDANVRKVIGAPVGARIIPFSAKDLSKIPIRLQVPGDFNRLNALAALRAAEAAGADRETVIRSLNGFTGTWRRMEIKGETQGALVIDDYGHHPTEIRATLKALREQYSKRRLICVFQPHQYSRTKYLLTDFQSAFADADWVIVPNIYEARDSLEDKKAMSAEHFVKALAEQHPRVTHGQGLEATARLLRHEIKKGDVVVTMGAGDVTKIGEMLMGNI